MYLINKETFRNRHIDLANFPQRQKLPQHTSPVEVNTVVVSVYHIPKFSLPFLAYMLNIPNKCLKKHFDLIKVA